jgi:hypothetical protein
MIELSGMRRSLLNIFPALLLLCPSLVNGSPAHRTAISMADAAEVLTLAVKAAAQSDKLPSGYCVITRLDSNKIVVNTSKKAGGWSVDPPEVGYRLVVSPKLRQIPPQAIISFPIFARRSGCRHTLTFHEPEFLEVRQPTETDEVAIVAIDDQCPLCGVGYSVSLRRSGKKWIPESPGISLRWIS